MVALLRATVGEEILRCELLSSIAEICSPDRCFPTLASGLSHVMLQRGVR
jgi:hypothetical protein